jgi:hypothetical protein
LYLSGDGDANGRSDDFVLRDTDCYWLCHIQPPTDRGDSLSAAGLNPRAGRSEGQRICADPLGNQAGYISHFWLRGSTNEKMDEHFEELAIDPNVDEARNYLIEDLVNAQSVERIGFLAGLEPATRNNSHRNLMNAPYWTDGGRVVLLLSNESIPLKNIDFFT